MSGVQGRWPCGAKILIAKIFVLIAAAAVWSLDGGLAAAQETVSADLRIENGKLSGGARVLRVSQGDTVTLRWTSDRAVVVHLHGYDLEQTVSPGAESVMSLEARATGRFPVELHAAPGAAGHSHDDDIFHKPLLYLEVHPR